jgi:hypothetical protein
MGEGRKGEGEETVNPWVCCAGDKNPFRREPVCVHCGDIRIVSTTDTFRRHEKDSELRPCPYCGDPIARENLGRSRFRIVSPSSSLSEADLTIEEKVIVKDWRNRNFHMADCLRWIEGRRYREEP